MANYTILLIDYEPRSIERFRDPLVAAGYRIEIATDGISGVEAFHRLNPDMVLVEAMIPKKHGFEVCQELKRTPHGRRTPVLITTSVYKGRKYRTQALHIYGCDEYIEKPIAAEQLLEIVGKFFGADVTPNSERPAEAESRC
jgi:DNA-binding response OmpR family regulator